MTSLRKHLEPTLMEKTSHESSDKQHILLTSLGKNAFPTEYEWGKEKVTASLAPLALIEFLKKLKLPMPDRVVAVVTEEAKVETWSTFQSGICKIPDFSPLEVKSIDIPNGVNSSEIGKILESVAQGIPEGAKLTLDVTHGLRHFPFIFYALVLYLKSLRGVEILGAYYGMVDAGPSKPIIDLQPLLELPEWFHAVRMFRDQGTTKPMASLLQPLTDQLHAEGKKLQRGAKKPPPKAIERYKQANQVKRSIDLLEEYAFAYESALPLELEKASKGLIDLIQTLPDIDSQSLPPLVDELTGNIVSAAQETAFDPATPIRGGLWKKDIALHKEELKRQAYMIDLYLERDQLSLAVGLMREWVVSWAIWKSDKTEEIKNWLDNQKVRPRYERRLGAIGTSARSKGLGFMTPEQEDFRDFWNRLTSNLRNALHHHAMRPEALETEPKSLKDVKTFWNKLKEDGLEEIGGIELPPLGGQLLISPQGGRPGVLFSALKITNPDTCLVICSDTSADSIRDASCEARFKGHIEPVKLVDPLGGFNEIETVTENATGYLSYADEVVANITGGSTLMGVIVQQLVEEAQKLDCPVKRFALIDRRSTEEQNRDPFVQSEFHWLD